MHLRARVLLSLKRALLGEVTSEMRAISVGLFVEKILVTVYHDGPVAPAIVENFDAIAITQVIADFPYPERGDPKVELQFQRCDSPQPIAPRGQLVYARKEE